MIKFIENITPDHDFQPDANYILALCYQNLKEYDNALKVLKKIEKLYPQNMDLIPRVKVSIAKNLYQKNAVPEALKEFKLILYKFPKTTASLDALLWLGEYYAKINDLKNAIPYYEQIISDYSSGPETAEALYALGSIYYKQEDYEKALSYFKQIKPEDGQEIYTQAKLSIADTFARQLDPLTAIQTYENIIKSSPEFARDAYIKIAEIYEDSQKYQKALTAYRNALSSNLSSGRNERNSAELQFQIGDLCEILNKPDEAISEYLKIPYLYPEEIKWVTKAHLRIARIFEDKKDWANAKLMYEKIVNHNVEEKAFAQERLETINKILKTK
jgi:tetratricopeptide (TPR) repeat protein